MHINSIEIAIGICISMHDMLVFEQTPQVTLFCAIDPGLTAVGLL